MGRGEKHKEEVSNEVRQGLRREGGEKRGREFVCVCTKGKFERVGVLV